MQVHKDFEIWWDEETQKYRFSVEYWGNYSGRTLEEIKNKVKRVRMAVKIRLKEIDKENKAYYARLAKEEEEFKLMLRKYKEWTQRVETVLFTELKLSERRILLEMIKNGATELEIKEKFNVNSSTIAQLRRRMNENVCEDV
jgi:hypothetical protein